MNEKLKDLGIEKYRRCGLPKKAEKSIHSPSHRIYIVCGPEQQKYTRGRTCNRVHEKIATETSKKIVLITNQYLTERVTEMIEHCKKQIVVIPYTNYEELDARMEEAFKAK